MQRAKEEGRLQFQQEEQRKKDKAERDKEISENMSRYFGGFKSNRKQRNSKQSIRKQKNKSK